MKLYAFALSFLALITTPLVAQEQPEPGQSPKPPVSLNDSEKAFVELLHNAALVGRFSVQGKEDNSPAPERYTILSATKLKDSSWIITARITYGKYDLPVPVPVTVAWADDTPMIQVTDLTIPGMGTGFTSRVLFYGDRYAGTWQHGKVGGHMWGMIEKNEEHKKKPETSDQPAEKSSGDPRK